MTTPNARIQACKRKSRRLFVRSSISSYREKPLARFIDGTIDPSNFHNMTDDEIRTHLIVVKGIGRWTADMFLMFTLYRPDA
jgi:DNA-3-methyladenine glycosylase II